MDVLWCDLGTAETGACSAAPAGEIERVVWDVGDYQIASCNWVLITTSDRLPP